METECPRICSELELPGFSGIDPEIDPEMRNEIDEIDDFRGAANISYSRPKGEKNLCGCIVELPFEIAALSGVARPASAKRPFFGTRHPYLHHGPNDEDEDEEEDEEEEYAGKRSVMNRIRKFFLG